MKIPLIITPIAIAASLFATSSSAGPVTAGITTSVRLAWDPNPERNVTGYRVHLGFASGTRAVTKDAGLTTNLVWSGLSPGRTNYFTVTAYNSAGLESDPSNEVIFAVEAAPIPPTGVYGVVTQIQTTVFATVTNVFVVRP